MRLRIIHWKWCAVILDIHNAKATTGKPSVDFDEAREEFRCLQAINNQQEPYIFVLSGNKQYQTESSTLRKPSYCKKNVYDKNNGDYEMLFDDILKIQSLSPLYNCQCRYSDVLTNAKALCGDETYKRLLMLLYDITVNNINNKPSLFNEMRKILENIMDGLKMLSYSYFTENSENISLNNLSNFIDKDKTVPEYIQRAFHTLTRVVQDGSHCSKQGEHNILEVDYDVSSSRAPYLLRSCLYELCNILIWMRSLA